MDEKVIQINVEDIMKEIRQNIAARGETPAVLSFDENTVDQECEASFMSTAKFSAAELHQEINLANVEHNINYYQMIPAGGVKSFIKRSIRKVIAFIILPLRNAQNQFNAHVVRSLMQMEAYTMACSEVPEKQEEIIEKLYKKVDALERRCEALEEQLKAKEQA